MPRCTSRPENLDEKSPRRCREHWETIVKAFELGTLWDEYGVVGDIVVRLNLKLFTALHFFFLSLSCVVPLRVQSSCGQTVGSPLYLVCQLTRDHWQSIGRSQLSQYNIQ